MIVQGQLVILATTVPGVSHPGVCGIVTHVNGPAAITVHFKGPDGVPSHATATSEQLRPYTGACPVCDTKPSEKHRFSTCAECGHRWADPRWLYSGSNVASDADEHGKALAKAVQDVSTLIENTVPASHVGLHQWLSRPVVRAARGLE